MNIRPLDLAAEARARQKGGRWLHIGGLATNGPALCCAAGFKAHPVELEKDLGDSSDYTTV
ncbi:hypothetical protein [Zobellella sp. DQSA1]|uniref:hypothetical protein n=1 Tax=Zobellella sp. DQSA1 TaxID=3342386 RepID=UPI0035C1C38A